MSNQTNGAIARGLLQDHGNIADQHTSMDDVEDAIGSYVDDDSPESLDNLYDTIARLPSEAYREHAVGIVVDKLELGKTSVNNGVREKVRERRRQERTRAADPITLDRYLEPELQPDPLPDINPDRAIFLNGPDGESRPIGDIADESVKMLADDNASDPEVFHRGGTYVRITTDERNHHNIDALTTQGVRGYLSRCATYVKINRRRNGDIDPPTRANCPTDVSDDAYHFCRPTDFHPLHGIAHHPILTYDDDKIVLDNDIGYNEHSGYYMPEQSHVEIQDIPVDVARQKLLELLGDFPYVDDTSYGHVLSIPLTMICRPLIDGSTPIHAIHGHSDSGKTLITQVLNRIVTGEDVSECQAPTPNEDWRKSLLPILMQGTELVFFDNITTDDDKLDAGSLASAVTAQHYTDRLLGHSKTVSLKPTCTWVISGEQLAMDTALASRCISVHIDRTKVSNYGEFTVTNPLTHALNHRQEYLSCIISLINHWISEGCPNGDASKTRFETYSAIIGGILTCNDIPYDFNKVIEITEADDDEKLHSFITNHIELDGQAPNVTRNEIRERWEAVYPGAELASGIFNEIEKLDGVKPIRTRIDGKPYRAFNGFKFTD